MAQLWIDGVVDRDDAADVEERRAALPFSSAAAAGSAGSVAAVYLASGIDADHPERPA